jgi:AraC-like DNA-binding protein
MRFWRDTSLPGGLELLRASCFDYRFPAHFHEEFVIAAFASGAQRHRVARHEGIAGPGSVMVIQPGEVHTGEAAERDLGWTYCAFYPSADLLEQIADDAIGGSGGIDFGREVLRQDSTLAHQLLTAHIVIATAQDQFEKEAALYEVLGVLIARYGERVGRGSRTPDADLQRAIEFLHSCHAQQITVGEVAASVGLSEYHFMRSFRAKSGMSVHSYLTLLRLNRAKSLLAQGAGAAETALQVGFCDQSHLINQFRRYFGVTPGAFVRASC